MPGELWRSRRADECGPGWDHCAVLAAVIGLRLTRWAGGGCQWMAVPVTPRPLIAFAPLNIQDEKVISGGWRACVAARPIARHRDLARRGYGDAEGIADSVCPDRIGRAEWVVWWYRAVGAVAQDLAAQISGVLRRRG